MRNFVVTIDGKQYQVGVEEVGAGEAAPANGTKVNAPMPGLIKALSLAEGATFKKGDVILVLEAMKMDNDITAPCDGRISYKVNKGTNVDTGELMAVIG